MPLHERIEDPGRFTIPLRLDHTPEAVLAKIVKRGHIVVMPGRLLSPNLYTDANILAAARYTGIVLEKERLVESNTYNVRGQGLVRWLHDAVLFNNTTYTTATTVDEILTQISSGGILPPAIEAGTITTTGVSTWPGGNFEEADTSLKALRTVALALNLSWKVNPDGTLDACLATRDEVNKTTLAAITHVLTPEGWGDDPLLKGIEAVRFVSRLNADEYATRVVLVGQQFDGERQIIDFKNRTSIPEKDLHGNQAVINVEVQQPPTDTSIDIGTWFDSMLAEFDEDVEIEFEALQWELSNGIIRVGDHLGVYAPPSVVDETNKRWHRGRYMALRLIQLTEYVTKLRRGMDVFFRDKDAVYTRLTPYVEWEV